MVNFCDGEATSPPTPQKSFPLFNPWTVIYNAIAYFPPARMSTPKFRCSQSATMRHLDRPYRSLTEPMLTEVIKRDEIKAMWLIAKTGVYGRESKLRKEARLSDGKYFFRGRRGRKRGGQALFAMHSRQHRHHLRHRRDPSPAGVENKDSFAEVRSLPGYHTYVRVRPPV